MLYKILYRVGAIVLALGLLIIAGILEAEQKYGKQRREEEEKMAELARNVQRMDELTKDAAIKPGDLVRLHSQSTIKETYDLIDEIYAGIESAEKKMISMEGYFLTYHKALALQRQLIKFEKLVTDSLHSNKLFASGIMNFEERERKGKKVSWENYYFENVSKDSVISYLRQMKAVVAVAEVEMARRPSGK